MLYRFYGLLRLGLAHHDLDGSGPLALKDSRQLIDNFRVEMVDFSRGIPRGPAAPLEKALKPSRERSD